VCAFYKGDKMDEKYMRLALKESKKSLLCDDVPVGAIVVKNNVVIAKGHNIKESTGVATKHAEIIAIEKACRKLKSWRLDNCDLYVTMEPCLMCSGAIIQSRIGKVVYGITNEKFGFARGVNSVFDLEKHNHKVILVGGVCEKEIEPILKDFFKGKRKQ